MDLPPKRNDSSVGDPLRSYVLVATVGLSLGLLLLLLLWLVGSWLVH
jgi:hypothetical protein